MTDMRWCVNGFRIGIATGLGVSGLLCTVIHWRESPISCGLLLGTIALVFAIMNLRRVIIDVRRARRKSS